MNVIGMMPLRCGSKGVANKNVRMFGGRMLFTWNLDVMAESGVFDRVYVNTNSHDYAELTTTQYGSDVRIFNRSERTARDTATTLMVIQEFIERENLEDEDVLMYSQATSPYLTHEDIEKGMEIMQSKNNPTTGEPPMSYRSFLTVGLIKRFIWSEWGTVMNAPNERLRRQDWKGSYIENGCLYGMYVGDVRLHATRNYLPVGFIIQPHYFEIDESEDWNDALRKMGVEV
jgi:CMP-N-acetylneuraminic acid synthetase